MSALANAWAKQVVHLNLCLTPADRRIIVALARAHTIDKGVAIRSYAALVEATQNGLRTVKRSVERLERLGLIERCQNRQGQRQSANGYILHLGVLRVPQRHSQNRFSGCQNETPEVVVQWHPEEFSQSATTPPPNTRAHTRKGRNPRSAVALQVVGGRDAS